MLQFGRSYIRDSGHFLEKIKISGCTSDNLILVKFNSDTFQQISGTAIGTELASPYACSYMDHVEQKFIAMQINPPLIWLRYLDDIFNMASHGRRTSIVYVKY